jgi:ABC-type Zn uptake system ZnuABC Zn-binding protein ZnuA
VNELHRRRFENQIGAVGRRLGLGGSVLVFAVLAQGCGDDRPDSVAGCGGGEVVEGRPLRVAATVAPITNMIANITAGTDTIVSGIVPEGIDSHTYEPAPSVAATLDDADVVFLNGLSLDEPTKRLAESNLSDRAEICELGTTVLPPDRYLFDFSFPKEGGKPNPHLWTNPVMVREYATLIGEVLSSRDPANASRYRVNLADFTARVDELDVAIRTATATIPAPRRMLLTYHDAYAYFAAEYGWTVLGAVQPSSFDEPTPREIARLIEQIRATGVPAIFGSEVFPSPVLAQIAAETGITYSDDLRDDDLPGELGDADHSWLALMQFNYVTMVEALGGDATALHALDTDNVGADSANY